MITLAKELIFLWVFLLIFSYDEYCHIMETPKYPTPSFNAKYWLKVMYPVHNQNLVVVDYAHFSRRCFHIFLSWYGKVIIRLICVLLLCTMIWRAITVFPVVKDVGCGSFFGGHSGLGCHETYSYGHKGRERKFKNNNFLFFSGRI